MYKGYLFFDIDGTLEDSYNGKGISDSTLKALKKAQKNGYACFICSGRNLGGLSDYRSLGMTGYIFSDGGGIKLRGKRPVLTPIREDLMKELQELVLEKYRGGMLMASLERAFADPIEYEGLKRMFGSEDDDEMTGMFDLWRIEEHDGEEIMEIDVSFESDEVEALFVSELNPELEYISTSASYGRDGRSSGEVTMRGVNKGAAARKIVEMLGGNMKDTYAFGDSMNDASVLQACQYGIAMGNSCQELKDIADYVTEDIGDDGLRKALEHFSII